MADLTELQSSDSVKVMGASSTGLETNPVNASANGDLFVRDILNTSVVQTSLTITTSAVECKVGGTTLANRKLLMIQVNAAGYSYGFSSGSQPFSLPNGSTLSLSLGPNISVWVIKSSGSSSVAIAEIS